MVYVDTPAAIALKNQMADSVNGMRAVLKKIETDINAVGWQGSASSKFADAKTEWSAESDKLNVICNDCTEKVGMGTTTFIDVDDDGVNDFVLNFD